MPRPKPFSRNSVSLSSTEKREWKNLPARQIEPGDIVLDVGKVQSVNIDDHRVTIEVISGDAFYFDVDRTVLAFVKSPV